MVEESKVFDEFKVSWRVTYGWAGAAGIAVIVTARNKRTGKRTQVKTAFGSGTISKDINRPGTTESWARTETVRQVEPELMVKIAEAKKAGYEWLENGAK